MKRLLLLFLLSPVMILAQGRQKAAIEEHDVDTVANMRSMSLLMSNNRRASVSDFKITHDGEFETVIIFHHIVTPADSAGRENESTAPIRHADEMTSVPTGSQRSFNTDEIKANSAEIVPEVPSLPAVRVDELAPIVPVPAVAFSSGEIIATHSDVVTAIPALPGLTMEFMDSVPLVAVVTIKQDSIPGSRIEKKVLIPPLPDIVSEEVVPVPSHVLVAMAIDVMPARLVSGSFTIPPLPEIADVGMTAVPLVKTMAIPTSVVAENRVETITNIPQLPLFISDSVSAVVPLPAVRLNIGSVSVELVDIIAAIPALPEVKADEVFAIATLPTLGYLIGESVAEQAVLVTDIPPQPLIIFFEVASQPTLPVFPFTTAAVHAAYIDTVNSIPALPDVITDAIVEAKPLPVVAFNTHDKNVFKASLLTSFALFEEIRTPVDDMHLSPDGYSLLQKMEGYSPELYSLNDGGFTIGFGFFVPFNEGAKWRKGVTWEEAEQIMRQKMPAYEAQVKQYVNVPLTQYEFDALTMLAYNLGGFSKATSIINDINNQADFDKLQSDWKRFVHSKAPNVSKGLMNRRKDELSVRNLSEYQPDRKIQVFKSRK